MAQFSTTTLVNKSSVINVVANKLFGVKFGPTFKKADAACIEITKTAFQDEAVDTATINLAACSNSDKTYRLNIYVRSIGNADPVYANNWVFKGKPFVIEFAGGSNIAVKVAQIAKDYMLALYDHKQLEISGTTNTLTVSCINGYQRLFEIAIEEWVTDESAWVDGRYKELSKLDRYAEINDGVRKSDDNKISVTVGNEGKGTYEQVLKDLRLPTGDNFAHLSRNAAQMPIVDGKYTQYTFIVTKAMVGFDGGLIKNPATAVTSHHFFVESGAVTAFEAAITSGLGLSVEEEDDDEPATEVTE